MKKIIGLLMSFMLILGAPTFSADEDIVQIAAGNSDFSILVAALQKAELVSALQGEGPFTVFAPTNAAFEKLLSELGITSDQLLNHPQLKEILLYHVVSGQVLSSNLQNGMTAMTLSNQELTVNLEDGVKINTSNVVAADLMATNGVIHVIDTVLVPPTFKLDSSSNQPNTVVDVALSSSDFSMLVSLLQKADLVEALQGEGPFTVFAPTNDAFNQLLDTLGISASDLMNQPDLSKVLLYHVISGKVLSSDLSDGLKADTLNGEQVTFDLKNNPMVNNSHITAVDIEAGNGVVHVIDTVLVPENFVYQTVAENTTIPKTGTITLLPIAFVSAITLVGAGMIKKSMK